MTSLRRLAAPLALVAFAIVAGLSPAGGSTAAGPDSHMQPLLDGCQRSQALILAGSTPEWVYVNANDVRQARLAGNEVAGRRTAEGLVTVARPAGEDIYLSHNFHDFNVLVRPDARYGDLLASGNLAPGDEHNLIEGEWESQEVPLWAWPAAGDHVRISGNWIWDCGHWGEGGIDPTGGISPLLPYDPLETPQDLASPGAMRGETTELHPLYEIATYRANAAGGLVFRGWHRLSRLDVWINGTGTPAHSLEECALRGILNWALARVVCPPARDVGGTYTYTMQLPRRPTPRSQLIVNPTVVHPETDPTLLALPVSVRPDPAHRKVTVRFTLPHTPVPQRFGITVSAGWIDDTKAVFHKITLDKIHITKSLDGDSEPNLNPAHVPGEQTADPGEWVLYGNVAGHWFQIPGIAQVRSGQTINLGITFSFFLPPGVTPRLFVSGHECDEPLMDCVHEGTSDSDPFSTIEAGFNDRPGRIQDHGAGLLMTYGRTVYRPPANPDPTSGNENLSDAVCGLGGCYQLTVTWTSFRL